MESSGTAPREVRASAEEVSGVASRLLSAKPVAWRGRGDLCQVTWTPVLRGTWLVLDLWAGISGLCMTLLQMGLHFYGLAAECDDMAARVSAGNMPSLVHVQRVEDIDASDFVPLLRRRRFRGIILGGGSPCQGNSSLNRSRRGLEDERSCQPELLARLRDDLLALPEVEELEVISFLENVFSMPSEVLGQYSRWMGGDPVAINAGSCGWTTRNRLYWLVSRTRSVSCGLPPPDEWEWQDGLRPPVLSFCGKKPLPPKVHFQHGYQPLISAADVVAKKGQGAMHTFTREFFHPTDRVRDVPPSVAQRFFEDNRRFPPGAYNEASLVWKNDQWRTLTPDERCQIMGYPPDSLAATPGSAASKVQAKNSMIGNGLYSLMALFCFLPALLEAKIPPPLVWDQEEALRQRVDGTVWEPSRLINFPGVYTAPAVVREMQTLFPDCPVHENVWLETARRLSICQLWELQAYFAWCRLQGMDTWSLPPSHLTRRDRTQVFASLSGQRYPGNSSKGLDHLLPPGLGKEGHLAASAQLQSPFRHHKWPEPDVAFVIHSLWVWRAALPAKAAKLRHILRTVARALTPLEEALGVFRVESAKRVAQGKRPALMACLTVLLRWPDVSQPQQLLHGYPIVGELDHSGIFRTVPGKEMPCLSQWFADGPAAVDRILASRPPLHYEDIYLATREEQDKGFCSEFMSRSQLDSLFGPGQWRPLERFIIKQADGKMRVIDNARKTLHNACTSLQETISTTTVDFVANVASDVLAAFDLQTGPLDDPLLEWMDMRIGTDDLPDAYRGLPVASCHQPASVIAIYIPEQGWAFTLLWGLAYGLESAVVSFNRFPQLGIAASRRLVLSMCSSYFDDELSLEMVRDHDSSQCGLKLVFTLLGAPPQVAKCFRPTANRHYLGASLHCGAFLTEATITIQPKFSTRAKVQSKLQRALDTLTLDSDEAGKLRGDLNWMFSMCAGHLGRFAGPILQEHQSGSAFELSDFSLRTLQLLFGAVTFSLPRVIPLTDRGSLVTRIYSDASFENEELRVGWVIFPPAARPEGGTCVVPPQVIASWKSRSQQIFPGESLAGLLVPLLHPCHFWQADCIWFVDNEAAVAALIRGSTRELDVHLIAQASQLIFHLSCARVWFEWIDTHANVSDGLSRLGLADDWSQAQGWSLAEFSFPEGLCLDDLFSSLEALTSYGDSG